LAINPRGDSVLVYRRHVGSFSLAFFFIPFLRERGKRGLGLGVPHRTR
jgi:hypothetical protein